MRTPRIERRSPTFLVLVTMAVVCATLAGAAATSRAATPPPTEITPTDLDAVAPLARTAPVPSVVVTPVGQLFDQERTPGGTPRGCSTIATHTDADFSGGQYRIQAGFAQGEIAAASYVLPPGAFPLRVESIEMIFATFNTIVPTTTQWTVMVWDGTPAAGTLVASYSSDGKLLPHIVIPPGTNGVNLLFAIDPGDPEQIIVANNSGSNTFSVGFRIDRHNNPPANPCTTAPPTNSNAFPTTDVSGVANPTNNWLFALTCPGGCPAGWRRFSELGLCRPSGDWVLRATWASLNCQPAVGACCLQDGTCQVLPAADCLAASGTYQGDNTDCASTNCPQLPVACCFPQGGCINLTRNTCLAAGGVPGPPGSTCATTDCFPIGACCLPDGTCADGLSPDECAALNGLFQGNNSTCAGTSCPEPTGACCFATGFCFVLTQSDCNQAPGSTWAGPGTDCADANGNGTADACETPTCEGDVNGDGFVDLSDLGLVLTCFLTSPCGDADGDSDTDLSDLGLVLTHFGEVCP